MNACTITNDRIVNRIYDVVSEAISAGWTPAEFKREAAECWAENLRRDAKDAMEVLSK